MYQYFSTFLATATVLTALIGANAFAQDSAADPGWPRRYSDGTAELVVYNPQVDGWAGFKALKGRCAFALRPEASRDPVYGSFRFEGETLVDADFKVVLLTNVHAFDMRFPGQPGGVSPHLTELTLRLLPSNALVVSLDRILAYVKASEVPRKEARVLTEPPPIFVSMQPAVLVILDGEPVMLDVEHTSLRRVLNTNWDLFQDRSTSRFYLRRDKLWLSAADLRAPFGLVTELPPDLKNLPLDQLRDTRTTGAQTSDAAVPRVIVVNKPAELLAIRGVPELASVPGTQLSSVTNTDSDLFFHGGDRSFYFLASGPLVSG